MTSRVAHPDDAIIPMLASVGKAIPQGKDWTFEPKYDGIRVLAHARPDHASLITRNGIDKAAQFPEIAEAVRNAAARRRGTLVIDGEIVALHDNAAARFQQLQARVGIRDVAAIAQREAATPAALEAFDLLFDGNTSLIGRPWSERRALLEKRLLNRTGPALRLGDTSPDNGATMLERARRNGWEGIMAKRIDARYQPGVRTRDWLKLKIEHRQEFVVGGYTDPRNSRQYLGALLVGYYKDGELEYAGHVGGGFSRASLKSTFDRLKPLARKTSPFATRVDDAADAHWVQPKVVVEAKFNEWTDEGRLRQPVFVGVRDDKDPKDVNREPEHVFS